jgi:hypothetical protein
VSQNYAGYGKAQRRCRFLTIDLSDVASTLPGLVGYPEPASETWHHGTKNHVVDETTLNGASCGGKGVS